MTDRTEKTAQAQAMLGIPLFNEIMDELEAGEINGAVSALWNEPEKREAHIAALKAIRNLRQTIGTLANEGQPSGGRKAPA